MNHNIENKGYGIKLRPVSLEDAEFICELRTESGNDRYIGNTSKKVEDQINWLNKYFKRNDDYYFCVETKNNNLVGTIAIYDIQDGKAEWGRWILKDKNLYSPTTVLLIFQIAFEYLHLNSLYCRTVAENVKVISFHDSIGLNLIGIEKNGVEINNKQYDLMVHEITKEQFPIIRGKLEKIAKFSERFL